MRSCHTHIRAISRGMLKTSILDMSLRITLSPKQNGRYFADDSFKCVSLNENVSILIKIPLKYVPKGSINNIPALVQIMAWCRSGEKPLSEPMMALLLTHICVARPQWVKITAASFSDQRVNLTPKKIWQLYDASHLCCECNGAFRARGQYCMISLSCIFKNIAFVYIFDQHYNNVIDNYNFVYITKSALIETR